MNSCTGLVIPPSIVSNELVPEVFSHYLKQGVAAQYYGNRKILWRLSVLGC